MASGIEAPRLFPGQLPHLDRFWVEAAINMNDCLNTTATTANAGYMLPYEAYFGRLPLVNTLAFMQLGFRRVQRANKSEPTAQKCFYPNRGRNHPPDSVMVLTSSGLTSDTRDVTWEVERAPIIAAGMNTATVAAAEAWEAD